MPKTLRSIEIFTGAGGLALGAASAGFHHQALVECNRDACDTLRKNVTIVGTEWPVLEMDIKNYDFEKDEGAIDLLAGGVPCQPFSLAGKHRGHADDRNLFPEVFRAACEARPRAILIENVRGLIRPAFLPYFEYILLGIEMPCVPARDGEDWEVHKARLLRDREKIRQHTDTVYDVYHYSIDCANFGVPQRRQRVFIVAFRSDLNVRWLDPEPTHSRDALSYAKWIDGSYWEEHELPAKRPPPKFRPKVEHLAAELFPPVEARWKTVRDAISDLPPPSNGVEHPDYANHIANPGARPYPGHTGSPWDEPAKTLKAGDHGVPGGENMLRNGNGRVRYFTVREAARLQTFPDKYVFCGAWSECLRQLGNAVPVDVAHMFASRIRAALDGKPVQGSKRKLSTAAVP